MRPSDLAPERWRRIDRVLDRVLGASPADRDRVVAETCGHDPELRAEVEALLAASEREEGWFEDPARALAETLRTAEPSIGQGRSVGRFRILREIGRGGMGVVYLAEDTRLGRYVALKALPPYLGVDGERRRRFEVEARAASALDHPNIAILHEVGETPEGQLYMVFAYYEGETLDRRIDRGPLPVAEALEICIGIARGLGAAHRSGIIHRDVKPSNVLLTAAGDVKLLDFGVAKVAGEDVTGEGLRVGTIAYMSPEYGGAGRVDGRADLWSLGVVLYEMLTGARPFTGSDPASMLRSVLDDEPAPPSSLRPGLSPDLDRIVGRLLQKDPGLRHRRTDDLVEDLRAVRSGERSADASVGSSTSEPGIRRIAVLPPSNRTGEAERDPMVRGVHEALVAELGRVRELDVVSRASVLQLESTELSATEITAALDVDGAVRGSVRRAGDQLVVALELVSSEPARELWSATYRCGVGAVFGVAGEAARAIAKALDVRVGPGQERRRAAPKPVRPAAYEAFTLGQFHLDRRSPEGLELATKYLRRAIELDPGFAAAHAVLAEALGSAVFFGLTSPAEGLPPVRSMVETALQLDRDLAAAHTSLGAVRLFGDWDWPGAESAVREAIRLNPSYAYAHFMLAQVLTVQRRYPEALMAAERSSELERYVPFSAFGPVTVLNRMQEFDDAIGRAREGLAFFTDFWQGHWLVGLARMGMRQHQEAVAELEAAADKSRRTPLALGALGLAYAGDGRSAAARRVLDELVARARSEYVGSSNLAMIHAGLGDFDQAFEWLEHALRQRDMALVRLADGIEFEALRSDPRFGALVRRVGLPEIGS